MSNYSTDRDALKAIVKILSPHCPSDVRNALARKLAESARGSSFENLAFRFSDIGHLFHPADPAAADALARDIRAARESGELQSIIPLEQGHIAPLDLLTWPQCPPVSAENPLSYWLPVTPQQSIAKVESAPGTNVKKWDDAKLRTLWEESIMPGVTQKMLAQKHGVRPQRISKLLIDAKAKFSTLGTSTKNKYQGLIVHKMKG